MNVLVTGSAGFVGARTAWALISRGDDVIWCDKKEGLDLTDVAVAEQVTKAADAIIHLASTCSTPGSIKEPMLTFNDTVVTLANVIEMARRRELPVIVTSSVKARDGMTPYGAAKRMVETWALEYRAAFGIPVAINRPGTIYGPGQEGSDESGWIAWFCEAKRTNQKVIINGDGNQVRDLLHVDDYVRLLLKQLDDIGRYDTGVIYDVGGGAENAVTVNEIAQVLDLDYEYGPARYGDAAEYIALNNVPRWAPTISWKDSETFA